MSTSGFPTQSECLYKLEKKEVRRTTELDPWTPIQNEITERNYKLFYLGGFNQFIELHFFDVARFDKKRNKQIK